MEYLFMPKAQKGDSNGNEYTISQRIMKETTNIKSKQG